MPNVSSGPAPRAIVSYPKSGRTWLRFMVTTYWAGFHGIECVNIYETGRLLFERERYWHLHLGGELDVAYWEQGSCRHLDVMAQANHATLLVRNVYETLVSMYHWVCHRDQRLDATASQFLRHPNYGLLKLVSFFNAWHADWRHLPARTDVVLYDDLRTDTAAVLRRVVASAGWSVEDELIGIAVEEGRFENMRELGLSDAYKGSALAPVDPSDERTFKVRRADPGEFREVFDPADIAWIAETAEAFLDPAISADPLFRRVLAQPDAAPAGPMRLSA